MFGVYSETDKSYFEWTQRFATKGEALDFALSRKSGANQIHVVKVANPNFLNTGQKVFTISRATTISAH